MALTLDQKIEMRERIAAALEKTAQKRAEYFNNNQPDSLFRAGIEQTIINYQIFVESFLDASTLDYERTKANVNSECEFWEKELDELE